MLKLDQKVAVLGRVQQCNNIWSTEVFELFTGNNMLELDQKVAVPCRVQQCNNIWSIKWVDNNKRLNVRAD